MPTTTGAVPTVETLREAFAPPSAPTVGLEEELMLLHPTSLDLEPRAAELLLRAGDDFRFKAEFPAAQVEIAAPPAETVAAGAKALLRARRDLAELAEGIGVLATAGLHPFARPVGVPSGGERYAALVEEFGDAILRQLCAGLHVHVAVRPLDRALAVHDALRSYLPLIAAVAANAPYYEGHDTGLCSWRPKIAEILPRQGVPPVLGSAEAFGATLDWGGRAGLLPGGTRWWWELRPHPVYGTLEVRVADAQSTVGEAAAVAALVQSLVAWLAGRHAAGERLPVHESWRIEANRWSAARHGPHGTMADLDTGELRPTADVLHELLDELEPVARALGCFDELCDARALVATPPCTRIRDAAARDGALGAAAVLAECFLR